MSFVRKAIVLSAAVYLLPKDPEGQKRLAESASHAVTWASTYCERNPWQCEKAGDVYVDLKEKASFGATLAYDLAMSQLSKGESSDPSDGAVASPPHRARDVADMERLLAATVHGTLRGEDVIPHWRSAPSRALERNSGR